MELVKFTPEELAKIEADKASPFVVLVMAVALSAATMMQDGAARVIALGLTELKRRADAAKMIILDRHITTNVVGDSPPLLVLTIIGQWAEVEKIEEMNRRAAIAGNMNPPRGRA